MKLKRSRLLAASVALGSFPTLWKQSPAAQFTYKLGHPQAVDVPLHVRSVQMAAAIKKETGGRLDIQVFPNSQLGSQTAMFGQLRIGSIQFVNNGSAFYTGVVPAMAIDSVGFAFTAWNQPFEVMNGTLGAFVRREFAAKGMLAFEQIWAFGFKQMTTSTKAIRVADDLAGLKMRTVPSPIIAELFKTLGASPTPLESNELYTALQTHTVDGQDTVYQVIESLRLFEVQKYLSVTNHIWSQALMIANGDAWNALPPDIQAAVKRNADKYAKLSCNDIYQSNDALADKLRRHGLAFNNADTATMRSRLGPYYARWKREFGDTVWALLESRVGKLG